MSNMNTDIVYDILHEAYMEIVGRGLIKPLEETELKELINDFVNFTLDERPATKQENEEHQNKEGGWAWKD